MNSIYILNDMKIDGIKNIPLLGIRYIKNEMDLLQYDALIFTSKNAVYSLDSFNKDWKKVPAYVIASKTAAVIQKEGGNVCFIGKSGHGNDFANELIPLLKNKKALYIKAKKVVSDLCDILKSNGIDIKTVTTYETQCNELTAYTAPELNSVIIFSSPSTIECFFKIFDWDSSYKAVVIGETTAKYLPKNINYKISPTTSIEDCILLAKQEALLQS
ncbi:MAG: uroporphyrinogen-III synthase [Candidatus Marinarcus sp.]|uniref:uroporphyrinogen-III synthase n=1 Tax=Candidatus Marinarcus sp. TaxID=3100987 RepID=UPI003AFFF4A4